EYALDILAHLKQIEMRSSPDPNYMVKQQFIEWSHRETLVRWLIAVQERLKLVPVILLHSVNLLDRFLSSPKARYVPRTKLQLVGLACLSIAVKAEDRLQPLVADFAARSATCSSTDVNLCETIILKVLSWDVAYANPMDFLGIFTKANNHGHNVKAGLIAQYLLEVASLVAELIAAPPSLLAAAALWLARISIGSDIWTPTLAQYSSYSESALIPTANLMLNKILRANKREYPYIKYAQGKYMNVCQLCFWR
ncbi:hypothetical protein BT96DRAFT_844907, partial [Gymnopus androsaceus JB14]